MFEISVEHVFSAAHALAIAGTREPVHGHNWHVTAIIVGDALDSDELVCDFHTVHAALEDITGAFHNRSLNDVAPFTTINPSAERVARHIADELASRLDASLAPHARVRSVRVTEAPGCGATYIRPR
ncbi:MAG: 6-carboxytetrahydropterin synthase [Planctomycetota bacterium]|nr:6-carboxytetrahydropterin synthase [Planctomycetota bacterium]